jgi:hypothetical protein
MKRGKHLGHFFIHLVLRDFHLPEKENFLYLLDFYERNSRELRNWRHIKLSFPKKKVRQTDRQKCRESQKWLKSRVTRFGVFSPVGRLFTLGSRLKMTEVVQILGLLFPQYKLRVDFSKKWVGIHFGRLFHKLIWSPC